MTLTIRTELPSRMMDSNIHSTRNSLSARLEELRSGMPQSPPNERNYSGYTTPSRYSGSFLQSPNSNNGGSNIPASSDVRANLQRRFTTSGDALYNTSRFSLGQPTPPNNDSKDMAAAMSMFMMEQQQKRPFEKQSDIDVLRQKKIDFERELEKFTQRQARDLQQLENMARELKLGGGGGVGGNAGDHGHVSEPSTPPSERVTDYGFPSIYSRHNRYSSSSIMSPPGHASRMSRSGSMMTSPPYDTPETTQTSTMSDKLPSKSVPGSRRGSNDRMSAYFAAELAAVGQRSNAANSNRYSMPVTSSNSLKRSSTTLDDSRALDPVNTTKFLFDDDDIERSAVRPEAVTSPGGKTYLQMQETADNFPILLRHTEGPRPATASQVALDLAGDRTSSPSGWPTFPRHRAGQQSLPQNLFDPDFPSTSSSARQSMEITTPPSYNNRPNRHSMEAALASSAKNLFGRGDTTPTSRPGMAMQASYSTSDLPTIKNPHATKSPQNKSHEDAFHKHNQSMGRIPPGAVNRTSRDLSSIAAKLQDTMPKEDKQNPVSPQSASSQSGSATFGPSITSAAAMGMDAVSGSIPTNMMAQFANPAYFNAYGMQMMNMPMMPANVAANGFNPQMFPYQAQGQYGFFSPNAQAATGNQTTSQQQQHQQTRSGGSGRRTQTSGGGGGGGGGSSGASGGNGSGSDESSRFSHARIENYQGEIYNLCKDQHGCRYLQRQLETRDPDVTRMIFQETHQHVVELMTDPFGNYLCQKLLEHANDEQRTVLVNNAAPQLVKIALNQHGTRALQKMIEYISTHEQTQTIIDALRDKVVTLIQDLNGNHVIQKCLNRLSSEDAQFIFDAVGMNCVVVGTHRHGCCVLQRCIDHASSSQRADLIAHITRSAHSLVRDPFGNYVLQYIIDLKDARFINPLVTCFAGHVVPLSKHKFSSNVIEKMLRGADPGVSASMVEEMLTMQGELEGMLKDQFANYVVQTALDYSEPQLRQRLVDAIKPVLPAIRQTPYGRRIQSKIAASEQAMGLPGSRPTTAGEGAQRSSLSMQTDSLLSSPQRQSGGSVFNSGVPSFSPAAGPDFGLNGSFPRRAFERPDEGSRKLELSMGPGSGHGSNVNAGGVPGMNSMASSNVGVGTNGMGNSTAPFNPFEISNSNGARNNSQQNFQANYGQANQQQNGFGFF